MTCVEKILAVLEYRKIPVSRMERDLGFSNGYIKQLKKDIPAGRLMVVCRYLDIPMEKLLQDDDQFDPADLDKKNTAAPKGDGLTDAQREVLNLVRQLDPDAVSYLKAKAQELVDFQRFRDSQ